MNSSCLFKVQTIPALNSVIEATTFFFFTFPSQLKEVKAVLWLLIVLCVLLQWRWEIKDCICDI